MRKMLTSEKHKICVLKYDNDIAENTTKLKSMVLKM